MTRVALQRLWAAAQVAVGQFEAHRDTTQRRLAQPEEAAPLQRGTAHSFASRRRSRVLMGARFTGRHVDAGDRDARTLPGQERRRRGEIDVIEVPDTWTLRGDVLAGLTDFNARRAGTMGLLAALLCAYYDEAGGSPVKLRALFVPDGPSIMTQIAERAVARGELAALPPPPVLNLPCSISRAQSPG